ncbi:MAG: hypothetical protein V9E91_04505 [Burkholderiaceae bacterium]
MAAFCLHLACSLAVYLSIKIMSSVDFGSGAKIKDPYGYLEGNGKFRRHLKLLNADDIKTKKLDAYLPLALAAAMNKT